MNNWVFLITLWLLGILLGAVGTYGLVNDAQIKHAIDNILRYFPPEPTPAPYVLPQEKERTQYGKKGG